MSPLRAWIDEAPAEGVRQVLLSAEESSHLVRSLRARRGDGIVLLDGRGLQAEGRLLTADPAGAAVEVLRLRRAEPLAPRITLAQGMPKGGTMDDLVRMACEAGAAEVVPLETSRCEVRLDGERARAKLQRWNHQAVEACKQCGNPWRTEIAEPKRFRDWLDALPPPEPDELMASVMRSDALAEEATIAMAPTAHNAWIFMMGNSKGKKGKDACRWEPKARK